MPIQRKPLEQLSLLGILIELSDINREAFSALVDEIRGPNSFDADQERIEILAEKIDISTDAVKLLVNALYFLYTEIHKADITNIPIGNIVYDLLQTIKQRTELSGGHQLEAQVEARLVDRLSQLLDKQENAERFGKQERLRAGFLPMALAFSSFLDLRPFISDDLKSVEEVIPLIQFRVRTDSSVPEMKNIVFQMDRRGLKRLKEEISRIEQKIETVTQLTSITDMITKRA